jgi:hypothetical protein
MKYKPAGGWGHSLPHYNKTPHFQAGLSVPESESYSPVSGMTSTTHLVLADDHALVLDSLRALISRDPDLRVV